MNGAWTTIFLSSIGILGLTSCASDSNPVEPETRKLRLEEIPVSFKLDHVVYFENHFICYNAEQGFLCLNDSLEVDSSYTRSIPFIDLTFLTAQKDSLFGYNLKDSAYFILEENQWMRAPSDFTSWWHVLYEDDNYIVSSCCAGEFGGSVYFQNRETDSMFTTPATCANTVFKYGDQYILTNSLGHSSGFTSIVSISEPKHLFPYGTDSTASCNWHTSLFHDASFDNYKSLQKFLRRGSEVLLDTLGFQSLISFESNDEVHLMYSEYDSPNSIKISRVANNRMELIDSIAYPWVYSTTHSQHYGNLYLNRFRNRDGRTGFILVRDDFVTMVSFQRSNKE